LSDRFGARPFATGGMVLAAATFGLLMTLPADFGYPAFGALLFLNGVGFGLFAGLDIPSPDGFDVGPRFGAELMYGLADLAPQLRADLGVRASFAYHDTFFGSEWFFDVVPDLRLLVAATPRLALFGDLGVGIAVRRASDGGSDTRTVASFVLGPGLSYALSPTLNLLAEIRFNFYTGGEGTFIALPSLGFQWH
jgi:hypothetical protein